MKKKMMNYYTHQRNPMLDHGGSDKELPSGFSTFGRSQEEQVRELVSIHVDSLLNLLHLGFVLRIRLEVFILNALVPRKEKVNTVGKILAFHAPDFDILAITKSAEMQL